MLHSGVLTVLGDELVVVLACGNTLLKIGCELLLSLFFGFFIKNDNITSKNKDENFGAADNFVSAVSDAASAVFSVCAYVILFSSVNEYMNCISEKISFLKYISPLLEVTNAVTGTRNILIIAFLLGFAGVSVWCQILSMGKDIKINFAAFTLSRVAHGLLSALITALLLKAFGMAVTVSAAVKYTPTYNGIALSLSMLSMVIVLIISLFSEKRTGNILRDIV